jgi:MHS family proline/betaine transporter-like MFS transporter
MAMIIIILFIPLIGKLAEKTHHLAIIQCGALFFLTLSIPIYFALQTSSIGALYLCLLLLAVMVSISYALIPVVLVDMFPTKVRLTGMSLPYNLANAIFGGTAPLIATKLIALTSLTIIPGVYLSLVAGITLITAIFYKNNV